MEKAKISKDKADSVSQAMIKHQEKLRIDVLETCQRFVFCTLGATPNHKGNLTIHSVFFLRSFAQLLKGILALCFDISTGIEDSEDEEQGSLCWLSVGKDEVQQGNRPSQLLACAAS